MKIKFVVFSFGFLCFSVIILNGCSGGGGGGAGAGIHSPSESANLPSDPLLKDSWHLKNTGQKSFSSNAGTPGLDLNVFPVWESGVLGTGVRIAVSDDGLELDHEDIYSNVLAGESRNYNPASISATDPSPVLDEDNHGTSVSGIIAGAKNNIGSVGVAPGAKLACFNFLSDGTTQSDSILIDQANGNFDIFNQSWGSGQTAYNPMPSLYYEQLKYAATTLRNGKGAIFVKSAGNSFSIYNNDGSPRGFGNSNIDGYDTTPFTIVTAAVNAEGTASSYSSAGSNIWISATGGEFGSNSPAIITTDRMGCTKGISTSSSTVNSFDSGTEGNSNCNYTSAMNGTSSAAPSLSGVIALMLEANPNLTWRDVKIILASTARVVDQNIGIVHGDGSFRGPPSHVFEDGWTTNAAGFKFHNWYGFGLVDANAAVMQAKTYDISLLPYSETKDIAGNWLYSSGTINQTIPDYSATGTQNLISVIHKITIEAVQIQVSVTHPQVGDLGFELTSPSGTKSILMNVNNGMYNNQNLTNAVFLSNAFLGESSEGNWTLKVLDGWSSGAGSLINWKINIIGGLKTDQEIPAPVSSISHVDSFNSLTSAPTITWTASPSQQIVDYEYSLGTSPGLVDIKGWTSGGTTRLLNVTNLALTEGMTVFANVRAVNSLGNRSNVVSSLGWRVDVSPPLPITNLSLNNGQTISSSNITINGTCEPASQIQIVSSDKIQVISAICDQNGILTIQISFSGNHGPCYLSLTVQDLAGNLSSTITRDFYFKLQDWELLEGDNSPGIRIYHTAIWTGNEMVVWGGTGANSSYLSIGSKYDPLTNRWTPMSNANPPTGRALHTAVWTGTEVIYWGGIDGNLSGLNNGGRYNPTSNTWNTQLSNVGAPSNRYQHTAVWTGSKMIIWGGKPNAGSSVNTGGIFDPTSNSWTPTNTTGAPLARANHTAIWTGTELIIWGGNDSNNYFGSGGKYNPTTDSWTSISTTNAPTARASHTAVWTGTEMIIWGGVSLTGELNDGASYNPQTNTWHNISTTGSPSARALHSAVWSGSDMIIWGGDFAGGQLANGAKYNPGSDTWTPLSQTAYTPSAREGHSAAWTGKQMLIWGGNSNSFLPSNGASYSP